MGRKNLVIGFRETEGLARSPGGQIWDSILMPIAHFCCDSSLTPPLFFLKLTHLVGFRSVSFVKGLGLFYGSWGGGADIQKTSCPHPIWRQV